MKKLGIAIVGAGAVSGAHVGGYLAAEDCEIRAICDRDTERAKKLAESFGLADAFISGDYNEVFARDDIDAVSICLPPALHCDAAVAALSAGKHTLVEKPMASSLEECDRMLSAQKKAGVLLGVVANQRFDTQAMRVKQMLSEEIGGKTLYATINSIWWRGGCYYDLAWRGTWEKECGGCLTSHAVHHIDMTAWLLGMPKTVSAFMGNLAHDNSECEDYAVAVFTYPGMIAQLSANILSHGGDQEQNLIFQTEKGSLSIPWKTVSNRALPNGFPIDDEENHKLLQERYDSLPEVKITGHAGEIRNFTRAILGKEELVVTGEQGRNAIELIMAIYKSAATHETVTLPIAQDDPFYRRETMTAAMPRYHKKYRFLEKIENAPPITFGRAMGK